MLPCMRMACAGAQGVLGHEQTRHARGRFEIQTSGFGRLLLKLGDNNDCFLHRKDRLGGLQQATDPRAAAAGGECK